MKNLSESNKKLISELVSDLEVTLIDDKKQCHSAPINEDIEKEIDEIVVFLLKERGPHQAVGRSKSSVKVGSSKGSVSVGAGRSRSRFSSSGMANYGTGATTFGRITNRSAGSRLENQNIHPTAMTKFSAFWEELKENGYEPFVTSGQRMPSHQRDLYDSGAGHQTAQPCRSDHQYGYALDINVNLPPPSGETESQASARMNSSDATWAPIVAIARKHGLSWQGSADRVHFYVRGMVTNAMKDACKDFYDDININSRGVAADMKTKEEENPTVINNILKIV